MHTHAATRFALAILLTSTLVGCAAHAQQSGEAAPSMGQFYDGSIPQKRHFKGKIVCLRCDEAKGDAAVCAKEGHHHALLSEDPPMLYPLLAENKETLDKINSEALHGKEVTANGKYYPGAGVAVIEQIAPVILAPIWGPHGGHGSRDK